MIWVSVRNSHHCLSPLQNPLCMYALPATLKTIEHSHDLTGRTSKSSTAGNIFLGSIWEVNEVSGDKLLFSSGTQVIHFGYDDGEQTILWDNCETYINNADGSINTERMFNFGYEDEEGYCLGIHFLYDFTEENS